MIAHPELVGGTRDRLDTSLMKAAAGKVVSKSGMEALRGVGILPGARGEGTPASGHRDQDRGRRRLRARHVVRERRGAPPGGRAGRAGAAGPVALPPPAGARSARARRRRGRAGVRARARRRAHRLTAGTTDHGVPGRPVPHPRDHVRGVAQRDPVGLSPAREAVPPRRGRRARAAPVPRHPGGLRAARRRRGPAAIRGWRPVAPGSAAEARVARRVAGPPQRPQAGLGPAGRHVPAEGRRRSRRGIPRRDGGHEARRGAAAPPEPSQGHARIHDLRRGRRDPVRAGVGRRLLVRPLDGHLLDDQPSRVRRPAQARPRVPRPGPARASAGRPRRRGTRPGRRRRRPRSSGPPPTPRPSRSPAHGPGRGAARRPRAATPPTGPRVPGPTTPATRAGPRGRPGANLPAGPPGTPPRRWRRRSCRTSRPCSGSGRRRTCCGTPGATG